MEKKENKYLSMDEVKYAVGLDVTYLNFCYYNAILFNEMIYSIISRILFYLIIYSGLLSIGYFIKSDSSLEFSIYLYTITFGILLVLLKWNKTYKEYLNNKLEKDKMKVASVYFSKTKEFEQEVWIKNKIFEEEIMPLIS